MDTRIRYAERAMVSDDKIFKHLMVWKPVNDKSGLLNAMGFRRERPEELKRALLQHVRGNPCTGQRTTKTGLSYEVTGPLDTPLGLRDDNITAWHVAAGETEPRFVTVRPK